MEYIWNEMDNPRKKPCMNGRSQFLPMESIVWLMDFGKDKFHLNFSSYLEFSYLIPWTLES